MIGIVTGLIAEARCWARKPLAGLIACAVGHGPTQAAQAAETLLQQGITGLVSFGLAGGLTPALRPGTVVLANTVVVPIAADRGHQLFVPHIPWRESLHTRLRTLMPLVEPIAASDHVIATVAARTRLAADTGARAVDMESGAVALCARIAGVPFIVVRVTADPAERTLPPAVFSSVDRNGHICPFQVLRALAGKPSQLPDLLRLLLDSRLALTTLCRVADRAGADCAFLP